VNMSPSRVTGFFFATVPKHTRKSALVVRYPPRTLHRCSQDAALFSLQWRRCQLGWVRLLAHALRKDDDGMNGGR